MMTIKPNIIFEGDDSAIIKAIADMILRGKGANEIQALIKRATNSAISSTSYKLQSKKEPTSLKSAIAKNLYGWPAKTIYSKTGRVITGMISANPVGRFGASKIKQRTKPTKPWGKMAAAISYKVDKVASSSQIGIIPGWRRTGVSAVTYTRKLEMGFERSVTASMRRYFAAIQIPLSRGTSVLKVPARSLITEKFQRDSGKIIQELQSKFLERLQGYK
jgi:hypothetical protein